MFVFDCASVADLDSLLQPSVQVLYTAFYLDAYIPAAFPNNQAKNDGHGGSLSSYCVVLVGGVEVGRTTTISHSSEPLWATEFHLADELLLGARPLSKNTRKGVDRGRGTELASPQPTPGVVALEVWDSVPEGDPVLLGAVEVPPDALQKVLSSPSHRGQETDGGGDDRRRESERPRRPSDICVLNLDLRPRRKAKQPQNQRLAGIAGGENGAPATAAAAAAKVAGDATAGAEHSGGGAAAVGVLSFSLKRVVADTEQCSSKNGHNNPPATAENGPHPTRLAGEGENVARLEKEAIGTRVTEVNINSTQNGC